jgi:glucosamine kinase
MTNPPASIEEDAKPIPVVQLLVGLPGSASLLVSVWYLRAGGEMVLFLGVDGGGTGCRAAVADASGRVRGRGEGGPANIWSNPEGARASILAAAGAAAAEAGVVPADLVAVLGLAGANVSAAAERLARRLPFARARIESDALIALKGALGEDDGITAALGTGSVFGVQRGGVARMIGGWGFLLGDQGSGARMGRDLCERALLAADGLAATSPLLERVLAEAGGPVGLVMFGQRAAPADFARFAPRILAAAGEGDAGAGAIVAEAEAWIARTIDLLQAGGALPICFLGGLGPAFAARLGPRYPGLVRAPRGSGLDGALALARGLT